jgi:hypothetical protein
VVCDRAPFGEDVPHGGVAREVVAARLVGPAEAQQRDEGCREEERDLARAVVLAAQHRLPQAQRLRGVGVGDDGGAGVGARGTSDCGV